MITRLSAMTLVLLPLLLGYACLGVSAKPAPDDQQAVNSLAVLRRLIEPKRPGLAELIEIRVNSSMAMPSARGGPGKQSRIDRYTYAAHGGRLYVNASSGATATAAVYNYLKNVTGCLVTWGLNGTGDQLDSLPSAAAGWPPVDRVVDVAAPVPWRYAWNMCTFGYSATWWDSIRWQREIDWMALHGVNLPLALIGQEYVWLKVFEKWDVTIDDLQEWFTGPAFLPWQRAGNVRRWAGPLSIGYLTQQATMQLGILQQMRGLGMVPVLPCFGGHVPKVLKTIFPNASVSNSQGWNSFPANMTDVWFLDPVDPVYRLLGRRYTEVQTALFGTDHVYSCDTFNEVDPTNSSHAYLHDASSAVLGAVRSVDPDAVWVLQAWLFHFSFWSADRVQAYLSGVPNDGLLILDLNSEIGPLAPKFDDYYGKFWVWNLLHNFGGRRGVYGNLDVVASAPMHFRTKRGSTMVGIGFTPEAIEQNPVIYELLTTTFWHHDPIPVIPWLHSYVRQRYGTSLGDQSWPAWEALYAAMYSQEGDPVSNIELKPNWENPNFGHKHGNATGVLVAWQRLLAVASAGGHPTLNGPWLYDFVDIGRQSMVMFYSDATRMLVNEMFESFSQRRHHRVRQAFVSLDTSTSFASEARGATFMAAAADASTSRRAASSFVGLATASSSAVNRKEQPQKAKKKQSHGAPEKKTPSRPKPSDVVTMTPPRDTSALTSLMLAIVEDLDTYLGSNVNYLLGAWLYNASNLAQSTSEVPTYLMNAKNQITMWGPTAQINDYACKPWSGLYKQYYLPRWRLMFDLLAQSGPMNWNQALYDQQLLALESKWNFDPSGNAAYNATTYPHDGNGVDPVQLAATMMTLSFSEVDTNYVAVPHSFIIGQDYSYTPLWTTDVRQLARLCDVTASCASFQSDGYLKTAAGPITNGTGVIVTLYVKR